jgi:hypothetical protein
LLAGQPYSKTRIATANYINLPSQLIIDARSIPYPHVLDGSQIWQLFENLSNVVVCITDLRRLYKYSEAGFPQPKRLVVTPHVRILFRFDN